MELIAGIVLVLLSLGAFVHSLPRHGKTARFVGTEWEGYVVVMMIGVLGIGVVLVIHSAAALFKAAA
jgi:hypothetical protein